jgi:uncharacterized protein (DUF433 family)
MIHWSTCSIMKQRLVTMSGACVFRGFRVRVAALLESLEIAASTHWFVEWFPGLSGLKVCAGSAHATCPSSAVP